MRHEVYQYISSQPDLKNYLRINPIWYRKLSRNPYDIQTLETEANHFYGRTFPQRMDKLQNSIQLASMLIQMFPLSGLNQR